MNGQVTSGQAGWHADPPGRYDSRYWDGGLWTRAVMRAGEVDTDPDQEPVLEEPVVAGQAGHRGTMLGAPAATPGSGFTSLAPDEAQSQIVQMLAQLPG